MIMDILGERLESMNLGRRGVDIFNHEFPHDRDKGVFFRYPLTGISVDPYIPNWHKVRVQVITRHTSVTEGEKFASAILKALTFEGEQVFPANEERGEIRLLRFFPETLPVRYPRLEGNSIEWSMHFGSVFSVHQ